MKTTIIFLGLVALSFTNANATTEFEAQVLDQQESATVVYNNVVADETEAAVFNPNSVITTYVKTVEDIIAENKVITERIDENVLPLSLETTIEDRIAEDNQIIESTISNEVYPLDFEKINRTVKSVKVYNTAITADLKL